MSFDISTQVTVLQEDDSDRDSLEMVEASNASDRPPSQTTGSLNNNEVGETA